MIKAFRGFPAARMSKVLAWRISDGTARPSVDLVDLLLNPTLVSS